MKKMIRYTSITVLTWIGLMLTACSSDELATESAIAVKDNVVTLQTTVSFDAATTTRALTQGGVKTFAVGERMAVVYKNTSNLTVKAVSAALTAVDIASDAKSAAFTFTLDNPAEGTVSYVYPAAMVVDDVSTMEPGDATIVNTSALETQDGTLASLSANLDCATGTGTLVFNGNDKVLPSAVALSNQFTICKFTDILNGAGSSITSTITQLVITDGSNTYTVNRSASAGPIYVAMQPITDKQTITFTANDNNSKSYAHILDMKRLTDKALKANTMYVATLRVYDIAQNGAIINEATGSINIAAGAEVTLSNLVLQPGTSMQAPINCLGNATIQLANNTTNTLKTGQYCSFPAIYVPVGSTLTIRGSGKLIADGSTNSAAGIGGGTEIDAGNIVITSADITATGGDLSAGIGGGSAGGSCGTITISGGKVTAFGGSSAAGIGSSVSGEETESKCGAITISGGTITATGDSGGAGIGSSCWVLNSVKSKCGDITITNGITKVEANGSIGAGDGSICGKITIDGVENATTESPFSHLNSSYVSGTKTWTLTKKN